jgi:hypothetical protein
VLQLGHGSCRGRLFVRGGLISRRCLTLPTSPADVIASAGCDHSQDLGNNWPMTQEDAYRRQVDLDVEAIVAGMARAHGAQAIAAAKEKP